VWISFAGEHADRGRVIRGKEITAFCLAGIRREGPRSRDIHGGAVYHVEMSISDGYFLHYNMYTD
jgi:hypothetical protein